MDDLNAKGLQALSAVASAAVILQGGGALATPAAPESTWTLSNASDLNTSNLNVSGLNAALGLSAFPQPLATASPQGRTPETSQANREGCCFSSFVSAAALPVPALPAPAPLSPNASVSTVLVRDGFQNDETYLLLALTLWFGATAPWVLQRFWLSQQQLASGQALKRPRSRQDAVLAARRRALMARREKAQSAQNRAPRKATRPTRRPTDIHRTTQLHYPGVSRFAKPRDRAFEVELFPRPVTGSSPKPQPVSRPSSQPRRVQVEIEVAAAQPAGRKSALQPA